MWLIIQGGKIYKWTHVTWQKAVIFNGRFFVVIDPFPINGDILICSPITTLKFVNKGGAKIQGNGVLKFEIATQSIFGLKNNFYITLC